MFQFSPNVMILLLIVDSQLGVCSRRGLQDGRCLSPCLAYFVSYLSGHLGIVNGTVLEVPST